MGGTILLFLAQSAVGERPQAVRVGNNTSSSITLSTGAPQGCVLSPLLFTLLTHDCTTTYITNHMVKFADDTTLVGLITKDDETHYRKEVDLLTTWCRDNNLLLNAHPATTASASPGYTQTKLDLQPPLSSKRKNDITQGIVDFIAQDMRPISVVEGKGFKHLLNILEPAYTAPARQTVMHALTAKYDGIKEKVLELIQHSEALNLTTDMWTSLRMESYMTVTAHVIDGDWKQQTLVLEAHTGENIATRLSEVADAFGIPGAKRVSVVCDNAANMALCMETLKESDEWPDVQGVRCVGHFKKGHKAKAGLKQKQEQQNVIKH
ncbi:hypothetical protein SKAU_G00302560 [Synaphobranchus kaupii]|uniref:Reverse transcriptase domain-containing protein n=1 Tax=Synaphobranchus kaupii TaxID=118154 RepID=A0A9Q1INE8_SYNKA|nr:hypothetical protein SKAU_G00302560 [Synaphobranchus kaupii]